MSASSNINNLTTPAERLKYTRGFLKVTRKYLEDKYGFPAVTLKAWENGVVNPSKGNVDKCIEMYKKEGILISEDWLMNGRGLPPKSLFQLNQYFSSSKDDDGIEEIDDEISMLKDVEYFKKSYKNAVAVVVSNDDMLPFYKCGDYVCGIIRPGNNVESALNKNCIVYLKNGGCFFRRLIKGKNGGYNLTCLNPLGTTSEPVLYNVDIESVAPVIFHRWKED